MRRTQIDPTTADVLRSAVHDLAGPASRLRVLGQLLSRSSPALDEDARRLVEHIQTSAAAVSAVAEGLRSYSEICTRPIEREPVDLNEALAAAIDNLRSEIQSAGAEVTWSVLPVVDADRFLVTWVLQELLTNAIRFGAGPSPQVRVSSATGEKGNRVISVIDNGPGIEAAMAERVFLPFKKLSGGRGAGLGLTICRAILERHGGRIRVEPRTGGAEVRFCMEGGDAREDGCR